MAGARCRQPVDAQASFFAGGEGVGGGGGAGIAARFFGPRVTP
jgi:hypothetical protein